jgi:hypothetical protein
MDASHPSLQIPANPRASPAQLDTNLMESSPPPAATTKDSSATLLAPAPCTNVELITLPTEPETPSRAPDPQLQPSAMVELQSSPLPPPFDQLQTQPLNSAQKGLKVYSRHRSRKTTSCAIHVSLAPSGAVTPLMAESATSHLSMWRPRFLQRSSPPQQEVGTWLRSHRETSSSAIWSLISLPSSRSPSQQGRELKLLHHTPHHAEVAALRVLGWNFQ